MFLITEVWQFCFIFLTSKEKVLLATALGNLGSRALTKPPVTQAKETTQLIFTFSMPFISYFKITPTLVKITIAWTHRWANSSSLHHFSFTWNKEKKRKTWVLYLWCIVYLCSPKCPRNKSKLSTTNRPNAVLFSAIWRTLIRPTMSKKTQT